MTSYFGLIPKLSCSARHWTGTWISERQTELDEKDHYI